MRSRRICDVQVRVSLQGDRNLRFDTHSLLKLINNSSVAKEMALSLSRLRIFFPGGSQHLGAKSAVKYRTVLGRQQGLDFPEITPSSYNVAIKLNHNGFRH